MKRLLTELARGAVLLVLLGQHYEARAATVTIDGATRYQTIMGYGASSETPPYITAELRHDIAREAVRELGLNRLRIESLAGGNFAHNRRWEWLNDDGDPGQIDWTAFNLAAFDRRLNDFVLPFKLEVEASGEVFDSYLSPSYFDGGSTGLCPATMECPARPTGRATSNSASGRSTVPGR